MNEITGKQVLAVPLEPNDAGAATVRDYLITLTEEVWLQDEGFSGKRPFGNSGWKYDLYDGLLKAGLIEASKDMWDANQPNVRQGDRLIQLAIKALFEEGTQVTETD